jgi:hypothetical protein
VWLKAAVIVHDLGTDYWVHAAEPLTFQGHVYQPLHMEWEGIDASSTMQLPSVRVVVANIQGQAEEYVENVEMLGKDVRLQILHFDLLDTPTDVDEIALQVHSVEITRQTVSVLCGVNLGLNDLLPKFVIQRSEFPGNIDDIRRFTIV